MLAALVSALSCCVSACMAPIAMFRNFLETLLKPPVLIGHAKPADSLRQHDNDQQS